MCQFSECSCCKETPDTPCCQIPIILPLREKFRFPSCIRIEGRIITVVFSKWNAFTGVGMPSSFTKTNVEHQEPFFHAHHSFSRWSSAKATYIRLHSYPFGDSISQHVDRKCQSARLSPYLIVTHAGHRCPHRGSIFDNTTPSFISRAWVRLRRSWKASDNFV